MAISKFYDPKYYVAFKHVFGSVNNKDITIHFLNDILELTGNDKIIDISFLSPIQDPVIASKKQSIVDVLCTDSSGMQVIIGMQVAKFSGFEKRAQYYAAEAYISQAYKDGQYHLLKEVIFIAIVDFILFPDKEAYKSHHIALDKITHDQDLKDFSFTFIELPKFKKTKIDQLENIVEKWIFFFKYANETSEDDLQRIIGSDRIIGKAYDQLNQFNWPEDRRLEYKQSKKHMDDYLSSLAQELTESIEIGKAEGEKRGIEIGKAEGEKRGIEIGKAEGEKQAQVETARKLLRAGVATNIISEITGLEFDEVEQLK